MSDARAKGESLKELLSDVVDAIVDEMQAKTEIQHMHGRVGEDAEAVFAALRSYMRADIVDCPKCGKRTTAELVANERSCLACWRVMKALGGDETAGEA